MFVSRDVKQIWQRMDDCGRLTRPFFFALDFELAEGVVWEDPLEDGDGASKGVAAGLRFQVGPYGNLPPEPTDFPPLPASDWRVEAGDPTAYATAFAKVRAGLRRGDSFLLNLTGQTTVETTRTPWQLLLAARAPYKFYWPGRFICFSPETFVRIENDTIRTYPMKGTAPAGGPDAKARLMTDYKETCEHYTIVDLMRNDLSRVSAQVRVERFRYAERIETPAGGLWQTSSEISGRLAPDWRAYIGELFAALLPAGSVSGAPKAATMALIRAAERQPRGYYAGVFGYFDGRNLESAVAIRFMEIRAEKSEEAVAAAGPSVLRYGFRSGGGVTIHSRCEDEYRELREKVVLPVPTAAAPMEFIETVAVKDGRWQQPERHERRLNATQAVFFGLSSGFALEQIPLPPAAAQGLFKCRIRYDGRIRRVDFEPYEPRPVRSLQALESPGLYYRYKYADRSALDALYADRGRCDDVLILQDGYVTDGRYANVAVWDGENYYTPRTCLLNGTKRQAMLAQGILKEIDLRFSDLARFRKLYFINAMLNPEDGVGVDCLDILPPV